MALTLALRHVPALFCSQVSDPGVPHNQGVLNRHIWQAESSRVSRGQNSTGAVPKQLAGSPLLLLAAEAGLRSSASYHAARCLAPVLHAASSKHACWLNAPPQQPCLGQPVLQWTWHSAVRGIMCDLARRHMLVSKECSWAGFCVWRMQHAALHHSAAISDAA